MIRIVMPCPTCDRSTLYLTDSGELVCAAVGCSQPSVSQAIEALQVRARRCDELERRIRDVTELIDKASGRPSQVVERQHRTKAGQMYAYPPPVDAVSKHTIVPAPTGPGWMDKPQPKGD
jgi:hypothetical protein